MVFVKAAATRAQRFQFLAIFGFGLIRVSLTKTLSLSHSLIQNQIHNPIPLLRTNGVMLAQLSLICIVVSSLTALAVFGHGQLVAIGPTPRLHADAQRLRVTKKLKLARHHQVSSLPLQSRSMGKVINSTSCILRGTTETWLLRLPTVPKAFMQ